MFQGEMKENESAFGIYCGSGIIIAHVVSKHTFKELGTLLWTCMF